MAVKRLTLILALTLLAIPAAPGAAKFRDAAEKQSQYAQGLYRLGIFYEAALEFERFIREFPQHRGAGAAAYYRAKSLYEFSSSPTIRAKARKAVAFFHRKFPRHAWKNLGYFLLGEIAMEEALEHERDLAAAEREKRKTAKLRQRFEAACKEAYPHYQKFVKLTDLKAAPQMTWRVVTARYNAGQCLMALKKYEDAIKEYRALLEPVFLPYGPAEAQYKIGECHYEWGRKQKPDLKRKLLDLAMAEYKKVMFFCPDEGGRSEFSDDARIGEAWCLFQQAKFADCRKLLKTNVENGFFKAVYEFYKGNPNKIDKRWVRALRPDIYYLYGKCYFKEAKFKQAKAWFERVMNEKGDNPWRAEATRMFDECRVRMDEEAKPLVKLADAAKAYKVALNKFVTGNREDAVEEFERIWLEFPGARTWEGRDHLLYYWAKSLYYSSGKEGRLLEAAAVFNYLAKTGNRDTKVADDRKRAVSITGEAAFSEGISYWRLGEDMKAGPEKDAILEAAILAFEGLAERNPEHPETPETLLNVGHFYLQKANDAPPGPVKDAYSVKAGLIYRRFVQLYATHEDAPKALLNLCYVYRELDQLSDVVWAADIFEKNFPKRPDVVRAIDLKGNAWFKLAKEADDPDQKTELFNSAAAEYGKLKPDAFDWLPEVKKDEYAKIFANALFYSGYSHEKAGDTAKAIDNYRAFIATAPEDNTHWAEGHVFCGRLYLEEEKYADAVEMLRPLAEALEAPDDTSYRGMAILVAALLKLADAGPTEKKKELADEAGARAEHFYTVYARTPIHHEPYLTVADAFEQAELFDQMVAAYDALRNNQRLHVAEKGIGREEKRARLSDYAQLLFKAGQACKRAGDVLYDRRGAFEKFYVAADRFYKEHLKWATMLVGEDTYPANFIDINFERADILQRANEPAKAADALNRNIAVLDWIDPLFLKAYFVRGNVWLECGHPKRALASYIFIIEFADPKNPARDKYTALSYFQAGIAYFRIGQPDKARAMFETLMKKYGESKDKDVQAAVTKAGERIKEIEKLEAEPEAGDDTE